MLSSAAPMRALDLESLDAGDLRILQSGLNRLLPGRRPLVIDGVLGPKTRAAYDAYRASLERSTPPPSRPAFDERTERHLRSLHPKVQPTFRQLVVEARELLGARGLGYKVISGNRTWSEQDALYARGRTKPGPIVTNARGGQSNHNFGVAIDGGVFRGNAYLDGSSDRKDLAEAQRAHRDVAVLAKRLGLRWGGDWKRFPDPAHLEYPTGYTIAQMRARVLAGEAVV